MIVIDDKRYITIPEYAELAGITKQAVYPKLEKTLKPYVKEINGQKYIDSIIFIEFHALPKDPTIELVNESQEKLVNESQESKDKSRQEVNGSQEEEEREVNESKDKSIEQDKEKQDKTSDYLLNIVELLQEQIREKDKQINFLEEQNEKLQNENIENTKHIREQAEKITMLLGHSQQESQYLLSQSVVVKEENTENDVINIEEKKKDGIIKRIIKAIKNDT